MHQCLRSWVLFLKQDFSYYATAFCQAIFPVLAQYKFCLHWYTCKIPLTGQETCFQINSSLRNLYYREASLPLIVNRQTKENNLFLSIKTLQQGRCIDLRHCWEWHQPAINLTFNLLCNQEALGVPHAPFSGGTQKVEPQLPRTWGASVCYHSNSASPLTSLSYSPHSRTHLSVLREICRVTCDWFTMAKLRKSSTHRPVSYQV